MYLEEDFEHAAAKDFVYLLADEMLDEHLPKIEVVDKDKVFKDEDRHKRRTVRRYDFKGIYDGHGIPADDDTRTV
jgi:hypothetical protein